MGCNYSTPSVSRHPTTLEGRISASFKKTADNKLVIHSPVEAMARFDRKICFLLKSPIASTGDVYPDHAVISDQTTRPHHCC